MQTQRLYYEDSYINEFTAKAISCEKRDGFRVYAPKATIGEDYAENWDFSSVDNFGEGVGVALTGTVRTVVDVGQTAVNAVCDVGNAIGDGISWVGDKITDGLSWLGGKIFG